MGFVEYLTLVFAVFKLSGVLDWSWWMVFSPMLILYGGIVLVMLLFVFLQIMVLVFQILLDEGATMLSALRRKK